MHDRDTKFSRAFAAACKEGGLRTNPLPVASPNRNGRCERFIQTIKHELLFKFILFGNRHLDYLVEQFLAYYTGQRAHTERGNLPPLGAAPDEVVKSLREQIDVVCRRAGEVVRTEGGMTNGALPQVKGRH